MGKFNKNWMKQLSESYIWEMQNPPGFPPEIPPGQPSPQPAPEPYNPNPFPSDIPPSRPKNMAGAPSSTPGAKQGNTLGPTTLGVNGFYYVYEYDQNGNLVRVHFYDPSTRTWVVG